MKEFIKKWTSYILALTVLLCAGIAFSGCRRKASSFTEEEHIQRIRERVEEKIDKFSFAYGDKCEGFEVYPLYNENEELKYCLIEFQPCGFTFVMILDERPLWISCVGASTSMYAHGTLYGVKGKLSPLIEKEGEWLEPFTYANGESIYYERSPYFSTGNINERKYFLQIEKQPYYICAVKKEGKLVNVISGGEVIDLTENVLFTQAICIIYFINRREKDL